MFRYLRNHEKTSNVIFDSVLMIINIIIIKLIINLCGSIIISGFS